MYMVYLSIPKRFPAKYITVLQYVCFVHAAIDMCSAVELLSLTIICIVIIDGGLCHEEWKRQSHGSGSSNEPTISEYSKCVHLS